MSRTNIDVDDHACQTVMERYHLKSKREAVNYALRLVAGEALDLDAARAMRGSGWEGDLEEMRQGSDRVILVDTSAWIEFLRATGSRVCDEVDRLLATDIAVCDAVRMEVLAGARDEAHLRQLRGLLGRATVLPTEPLDYETAASLYRSCRRSGETVRKMIDCLIGAVAVRHGASILHLDADFSALARQTAVEVHEPPT